MVKFTVDSCSYSKVDFCYSLNLSNKDSFYKYGPTPACKLQLPLYIQKLVGGQRKVIDAV